MVVEQRLREKISTAFQPSVLGLENESHMHNVPQNSETHFKLLLVSDFFAGMSRVQRQRKVNEVIADDLQGEVHAFAQRVYTSEEWKNLGEKTDFVSPKCLGGEK